MREGAAWKAAYRLVRVGIRLVAMLGWSDSGPDPAWGDAAARDLHHLVQNAGLEPPLVLVGASFGGYIIRLYHHAYPGEVSGMVFADAAHEDAGTIQGMPHRDPPPIPRSMIRGLSIVLGRLGMMRFLASDPGHRRSIGAPMSGIFWRASAGNETSCLRMRKWGRSMRRLILSAWPAASRTCLSSY
jgi:pimeloyl-ACP methyl ester carboxylesterase